MSNRFNAEQARQLAKGEDYGFEEMLGMALEQIKINAKQKSTFAAMVCENTPNNEKVLEDVIKELENRGFTVSQINNESNKTKLIIDIRF